MTEVSSDDLLIKFGQQELDTGCYELKIKGISIYNFIRRDVRADFLKSKGFSFCERNKVGSRYNRILSVIKSLWQILLIKPNKDVVLFHTFRLENVNGFWMDRFYDPIIEIGGCDGNFEIIETNNGRRHKNRCHSKSVFFDDSVVLYAHLYANIFYSYLVKIRYKKEFTALETSLRTLLSSEFIDNKRKYYINILSSLIRVSFYRSFLRRQNVKCVVSASRSSFLPLLCAAKLEKTKVFELQHGIEYGEVPTYSGFRDNLFTPDKFLSFGDFEPKNVYGIGEKDFVTIGWALKDYINDVVIKSDITKDDILVLSQPLSTDYIINSTIELAKANPERRFFIRNHPLEKLTDAQIESVKGQPNVFFQDLKETFLLAMKPFTFVIGDQSTAIYEALSYDKIVGLIALNERPVNFLKEEDVDCFWIINDSASFKQYLLGDKQAKKTYSIYDSFNKKLFNELIYN